MGRILTVRPLSSENSPAAVGIASGARSTRVDADAGELLEDLPLTHHGERESREWVIEEGGPGLRVIGVAGVGVAANGIVAGDRGPAQGRVPGERTAATSDVPADRQSASRPPADRSAANRVDASAKPADSQDSQPDAAKCDQAQRQTAETHDADGAAAQCDQSAGRRAHRQQDASGVVADRDPAASDPPFAVGDGRAGGLAPSRRHRGAEVDVDQGKPEEGRFAPVDPVAEPCGHRGPAGAGAVSFAKSSGSCSARMRSTSRARRTHSTAR